MQAKANKMKVLVISYYHNTLSSRPEAEFMLGLKREGVDIEIMTPDNCEYTEKFKAAGIKVHDYHPPKKNDPKAVKEIRKTLVEGKHDIVHLFNSKAITNGIKAAKGLPVKVVLYRGYTGNVDWFNPGNYQKYLHPRVDAIMCNAKGVEEHINKNTLFGKSKAITINKGHNLDWYKDVKAIDRAELPIPENAFVASLAANARRMKGVKYLLEATLDIDPKLPIHFLLIGTGLENEEAKKILAKSPNRDKVHFLGFRKDSLSIVKASNIFVLPSIKGESITKAGIEAMSLGVAPVITDIAGNRELVEHEVSGLVVPKKNGKALAKAIVHMYENPELCEQYGKGAKRHIDEKLNTQRTVKEVKAMYENLLK